LTGRPLSPQQAKFAELYIAGPEDVRGNATRSYLAAYPSCFSIDSAAQSGSRLLRLDKVRAYMAELREIAAAECTARLRPWMELAPEAQETLRAAGAGELVFPKANEKLQPEMLRSAVKSAIEILDRALGTTKHMHEHKLQGGIVVRVAGPPQVAPDDDGMPAELVNGDRLKGYLPPA
jgi:phage terminase small subunit